MKEPAEDAEDLAGHAFLVLFTLALVLTAVFIFPLAA
jgi:hypothetical protein